MKDKQEEITLICEMRREQSKRCETKEQYTQMMQEVGCQHGARDVQTNPPTGSEW